MLGGLEMVVFIGKRADESPDEAAIMNGKKCLNLKTKGYGTKPSNLSLLGFHGLVILKYHVLKQKNNT
uniref:SFRICE_038389 n=1 Tax=Spodoptera frugiperda TaxID=7108 RepID=A0A2H1WYJ8_SPOFR